jgi:hypothetical protein
MFVPDRAAWSLPWRRRYLSSAEFVARVCGPLADYDLKSLVVAGGAVCGALTGYASKDLDLFPLCSTDEELKKQIHAIGAHLALKAGEKNVQIFRTQRAITFKVNGGREYQVVLRRYRNVEEVLYSFDLGSAAVALDRCTARGGRVVFSMTGKFAYEHRLNILDLDVHRGSYERRVVKYWCRGFGLALTEKDPSFLAGLSPQGAFLADGRLFVKRQPDDSWLFMNTKKRVVDAEEVDLYCGYTYDPLELLVHNKKMARLKQYGRMCAISDYVPGIDLTAISVSFDALVETVIRVGNTYVGADDRRRILEFISATVFAGLEGKPESDIRARLRECADLWNKKLIKPDMLPFVYTRQPIGTIRDGMTADTWYRTSAGPETEPRKS